MEDNHVICVGTRKSQLAHVQAKTVEAMLRASHPGIEVQTSDIMVQGDADKKTPFLLLADRIMKEADGLPSNAAKSLWTEEMEASLCAGDVDLLVHSLKDVPTSVPATCELSAVISRQDPRDALIVKKGRPWRSLDDLPDGSVVGTSSTRRKAILRRRWPRLVIRECRGNIDTRISKLDDPHGEFSCIILAAAGLIRMGQQSRITSLLSPIDFPYAVGQGALGIESRLGDTKIRGLVSKVEDNLAAWPCIAERALLRHLQGGCSSPVGVLSFPYVKEGVRDGLTVNKQSMLRLYGTVLHPHGWSDVRANACHPISCAEDAEALGIFVAKKLLDAGAGEILEEIREIELGSFETHFNQPLNVGE